MLQTLKLDLQSEILSLGQGVAIESEQVTKLLGSISLSVKRKVLSNL